MASGQRVHFVGSQQYLACWVALTDAGSECQGTDPPDAAAVEAKAGSIVVFSSLMPYKTSPNASDGVRKAYVVQFAPDGSQRLQDGQPPESCDHPERQFEIAVEGGAA